MLALNSSLGLKLVLLKQRILWSYATKDPKGSGTSCPYHLHSVSINSNGMNNIEFLARSIEKKLKHSRAIDSYYCAS